MKIQEAIQICKLVISAIEWEYPLDYCIAIETLIKAVENNDGQSEEMDG